MGGCSYLEQEYLVCRLEQTGIKQLTFQIAGDLFCYLSYSHPSHLKGQMRLRDQLSSSVSTSRVMC